MGEGRRFFVIEFSPSSSCACPDNSCCPLFSPTGGWSFSFPCSAYKGAACTKGFGLKTLRRLGCALIVIGYSLGGGNAGQRRAPDDASLSEGLLGLREGSQRAFSARSKDCPGAMVRGTMQQQQGILLASLRLFRDLSSRSKRFGGRNTRKRFWIIFSRGAGRYFDRADEIPGSGAAAL